MDTNISNGLNKNIIIGIAVLLIIAGAALVIIQTQYPVPAPAAKTDSAAIERNLSELNALDSDTFSFSQDDIIFNELNGALNDVGEITLTATLNNDEQSLNNLSSDLTDITGDEAALGELDQALGDAAAN